MAEGRVAYLGPLGRAISYFADLGYMCPSNFNPADFFVQLLAIVPGEEEKCRERTQQICDFHADQEKLEKENASSRSNSFSEEEVVSHQPYKASWCTQFRAVLWRSWIATQRDKIMSRIRLIQSIITGLIAGLIYLQTPIDTSGVQNLSGAIFFLVTSVSFSGLQGVIFVFPAELPVFLRDHKNGMYRTDVYFLSKTLAELPIFILSPLLLTSVSYWMIGLRPELLPFIYAFAILAALTNVAISYGYVISSLSPSVEGASALGPPLMLPLMLFGGFFLKDSTVPVYFIWIKYISWFRYGFELLIVNQWDSYGKIDNCSSRNQTSSLCIPNGDAAIDFLGLKKDTFMIDIYALLALFVGFRIMAFLLLLRRSSKTQ
ncbi:protein white-like [Actinia tenebrosa]|uniref:Protein white-like n=1 Tax=Actinia tenebrosa TaxID=6105 RepID=A0A6P8IMA1_ACTTE|nr:protein white-like [Actinia tenebrosa]